MKFLALTSVTIALIGAGSIAVHGIGAEGPSPSGSAPLTLVTGEVAQVKGEFQMAKDPQGDVTLDIVDKSYVITRQSGEEMRLELDDKTKVLKKVNPGDKIAAKISPEGHTLSVTKLER